MKLKLKQKKPNINQVLTTCSWCGRKIEKDGPIYALGCKKRPEIDISNYEGKVMPVKITTSDKTIWAIVPSADSEARRHGKDFMFSLCSEKCGDDLKKILNIEMEFGELILASGVPDKL